MPTDLRKFNNKGRLTWTTREAKNGAVYTSWYYTEIDLDSDSVVLTDNTCDYNNDPTIQHDSNANIKVGHEVTGTGIPANSYVGVKTSNTEFELYKDGSPVSTTGGAVTNGTLTFIGGSTWWDSPYVTADNPAKKIVVYPTPGQGSSIEHVDVAVLSFVTDFNPSLVASGPKQIQVDIGDMPFTMEGFQVYGLRLTFLYTNLGNKLSVLTFH
tara:strand:- start:870 stop:1505 length:636 start_codon:yes stop_codon:yes gene_type:complete